MSSSFRVPKNLYVKRKEILLKPPPLPRFIPFTLTCVMSSWPLQVLMVLMIKPKGVRISVSLLPLLLPEPILSVCEE